MGSSYRGQSDITTWSLQFYSLRIDRELILLEFNCVSPRLYISFVLLGNVLSIRFILVYFYFPICEIIFAKGKINPRISWYNCCTRVQFSFVNRSWSSKRRIFDINFRNTVCSAQLLLKFTWDCSLTTGDAREHWNENENKMLFPLINDRKKTFTFDWTSS